MQPLKELIASLGSKAPTLRIALIGDLMVDENIDGPVSRISPEAPVLILSRDRRRVLPGGAGNVAAGIAALGVKCTVIGLIGPDPAGMELREHFITTYGQRFEDRIVMDAERPTTVKTRFWASGHGAVHQLFRVDSEVAAPPSEEIKSHLLRRIRLLQPRPAVDGYDLIILSDYSKGVITQDIVNAAISTGIPVIAAPKPNNSSILEGVDLVLPNLVEAKAMAKMRGYEGTDVHQILRVLQATFSIGSRLTDIVVTQGKDGIIALGSDGALHHEPTKAREVYDVTGAGDTVLAVFSVAYAAGLPLDGCMSIANMAAGIKVGKVGVATISLEELKNSMP